MEEKKTSNNNACVKLNLLYAFCAQPAVALLNLIFDRSTDCERGSALDCSEVHVHILAVVAGYETKTALGIEHFHFSFH